MVRLLLQPPPSVHAFFFHFPRMKAKNESKTERNDGRSKFYSTFERKHETCMKKERKGLTSSKISTRGQDEQLDGHRCAVFVRQILP